MALHQNESDITEAMKEAKVLYAYTIRDVEAHWAVLTSKAEIWHTTCIKEAEANCACTLADAENCCSAAVREAESQGALQAHSIQQSHTKDIQHLEAEAIEEVSRGIPPQQEPAPQTPPSSTPVASGPSPWSKQ